MDKAKLLLCLLVLGLRPARPGEAEVSSEHPYRRWQNGPPHDASFFPVGVWLQNPAKAQRYREAGFNLYIGLWKGPTESQLAALKAAGMKVVCEQNAVGQAHRDDPTIVGWMHGDEPDNAQPLGNGRGYGPPIPPERIVRDYERIRDADPTRPVLLNLGQGVAWDHWHGRGTRTNHPEDYPAYIRGSDIVSFDIYPVAHEHPGVTGKLGYVAQGVEHLVRWSGGRQVVWNCIECTRIHNPARKATPHQVRAEVWMSLIHGSRGLIYFVHEWQPKFDESALLSDPEMLAAVTKLNRQIQRLAPVLNAPTVSGTAAVVSDPAKASVALMAKRHGGALYLFAVAMGETPTTATFTLSELKDRHTVEVLDESRELTAKGGVFEDRYAGWDVHLYRIAQ
jgi:hypothetical protein